MGIIKEFFGQIPYFIKRFCMYHVVEVICLVGLVLWFIFPTKLIRSIIVAICFGSFIIVFGGCKARIYNNLNYTISAKPEDGEKTIDVLNNGSPSEPIDGFKYDDVVYKMPNGCCASVYENEGVKQHSLLGWIIFKLFGRRFDGWNELFCNAK